MENAYQTAENIFDIIIRYSIILVELVGVIVLLVAIVKAVIGMIKHNPRTRLDLAEGIALSLEFKMGSELLRTVIVRELDELMILGAVILLRAALTFLIQWEIKNEKKRDAAELAAAEKGEEIK